MEHDLYRAIVLEHARMPHNFGPLPSATHSADGINPLCGDKLTVYLEIGDDGKIHAAHFEGTGCAISLASGSLLTDTVSGLSREDARQLQTRFLAMLEPDAPESAGEFEGLDELRALAGVRNYPSRVKCATLAWQAFSAALAAGRDGAGTATRTVSTE